LNLVRGGTGVFFFRGCFLRIATLTLASMDFSSSAAMARDIVFHRVQVSASTSSSNDIEPSRPYSTM
jgi:hypothetical protein